MFSIWHFWISCMPMTPAVSSGFTWRLIHQYSIPTAPGVIKLSCLVVCTDKKVALLMKQITYCYTSRPPGLSLGRLCQQGGAGRELHWLFDPAPCSLYVLRPSELQRNRAGALRAPPPDLWELHPQTGKSPTPEPMGDPPPNKREPRPQTVRPLRAGGEPGWSGRSFYPQELAVYYSYVQLTV